MQDDHLTTNNAAKERTAKTLCPLRTDFEQPVTKWPGVWHPKVGARDNHLFCNSDKAGANSGRPCINGRLNIRVVELELETPAGNITLMLLNVIEQWGEIVAFRP